VFKVKEISSKSGLAIALSKLEGFKEPKVRVEQYTVDSEIGAFILWNGLLKGDIRQKVSVDLGCGTGILGIGALLLGAKKVFFVDSEGSALKIAKNNLEKVKSEFLIEGKAVFVCRDVVDFSEKCDTVVENPPFGVKVRHADRVFLKKAFEIGKVVYSFHKSESKEFIERFSSKNEFKITDVWDFKFPLKAIYKFHSRRIKYIDVSCFRFEKAKLFK
jgi:putative methylase